MENEIYSELSQYLSPTMQVMIPDDLHYAKLLNLVSHNGGMIRDIDIDNFTVKVNNKDAFNAVADVLDDDPLVEFYQAELYEIEPFTGVAKKLDTESIDVDMIDNFANFVATYIVFLKQSDIDYSEYQTLPSSVTDEENINEVILNKNRKIPLYISLNKTRTIAPNGTFFVIPHPIDKDTLLISIEYQLKNMTADEYINEYKKNIKQDIDNINHGNISHKLSNHNFTCDTMIEDDLVKSVTTLTNINGNQVLSVGTALFKNNNDSIDITTILEGFNGSKLNGDVALLNEVERIIKVNSLGKKQIKLKCKPGFKYDPNKKSCIAITGKELSVMRQARIKMVRNKKTQGTTLKTMTLRKSKKALRFRKILGVK